MNLSVLSLRNRWPLLLCAALSFGPLGGLRAAPAIDAIEAQSVFCGKTHVIPVRASGTGPFSYKVTSDNPKIIPFVKTGNPYLKLTVTYAGNGGTSAPFTGDLIFQLFRDMTPTTAKFIAGFAHAGFYDGKKFHRVLSLDASNPLTSIIAQGGDPLGTGEGGPGMVGNIPATAFAFNNELRAPLIFTGKGQLAMANEGITSQYAGTNGSQFFITNGPVRHLDFNHTIFGQLVRGDDVLAMIDAVPTHTIPATSGPPARDARPGVPDVDVVISHASIMANDTDAVLFLSAAGNVSSPATVTVTATDSTGAPSSKTILVSTAADEINDPPILSPIANVVAPLRRNALVTIPVEDLEFDPIVFRDDRAAPPYLAATFLTNLTDADGNINKNIVTVSPNASSPLGSVVLGMKAKQIGAVLRKDPSDRAQVTVGLGVRILTPVDTPFHATAGQPLSHSAVAIFRSSVIRAAADNFTATINWGDGSPIDRATAPNDPNVVTVARADQIAPNHFAVAGSHTYLHSGQYLVTATVKDAAGATVTITNTAFVSDGPLQIVARDLESATRTLALREIATFTDSASPGSPSDYTALLNWGDGVNTRGTIRKTARGFSVLGSHNYLKNGAYTVAVKVTKTSSSATATAWSAVHLKGAIVHFPPFAQSHLHGEVTNVFKISNTSLTGDIYLQNSGNKTVSGAKLRFYLSATPTLDRLTAIPLKVVGVTKFALPPIARNAVISGLLHDITVPKRTPEIPLLGKYLIMEIIDSDPLGDSMPYPRVSASPTALP